MSRAPVFPVEDKIRIVLSILREHAFATLKYEHLYRHAAGIVRVGQNLSRAPSASAPPIFDS